MAEMRIDTTDAMRAFASRYMDDCARGARARVIALSGALGAGKTAFTQALAGRLGVAKVVNSPTFVIQKIYALEGAQWERLVHIDAYRLKSAEELRHLGWNDLLADSKNLIVIEWPEHVADAIPKDARRVAIRFGEGETRVIRYE